MSQKIDIKESVKDKLEKSGINVSDEVAQVELISEVNKSNIAVERYDANSDKVTIKESLNG